MCMPSDIPWWPERGVRGISNMRGQVQFSMGGLEPVSRVSEHCFVWRSPGKELGLGDAFPDDKGILAHAVLIASTVETMRCNARLALIIAADFLIASAEGRDKKFPPPLYSQLA